MNDFQQQLTQSSPESRQEWTGKFTSRLAIVLIGGLVGTILIFLTVKGGWPCLPTMGSQSGDFFPRPTGSPAIITSGLSR